MSNVTLHPVKRIVAVMLLMAGITDPGYSGTAAMQYDTSTHAVKKPPTSAGAAFDLDFTGLSLGGISGGGTPGGVNQQVQFNNSSAFGGVSSLTSSGTVVDQIAGSNYVLHDLSDNTKKATFNLSNIGSGSTRTINIPNANSTTIQADTGTTNNFLTAVSAQGLISKARPDFSNLSGTIATSQQNIPVGANLYVDATNGNNGTALRGRFDKPFLTISAALAAASSGDTVLIGPGTFAIGAGQAVPSGVNMFGSGIDITTFTTTAGLTNVGLVPGNNSTLADFTVTDSSTTGAPIGCGSSDTAFSNAIIHDVKAVGKSDVFYVSQSGVGNVLIYNSIFSSTWDVIRASSGVYDIWNSTIDTDGSTAGASAVRGISTTGSTAKVRFYEGRLTTNGVNVSSVETTAGTIEIHNSRIDSAGSGTVLDLSRIAGTIQNNHAVRADGAALVTSGTIAEISRYAVRDNNLSDLVSSSIARTNLGATTVGGNFFTLTNPGAITFPRIDAANTVTARSAANFKTDLSLTVGTDIEAWDTQLDSLAALTYATNALKVVRVNAGETGFELAAVSGTGTVTNVATDATLTGGPITTTGTLGVNVATNMLWSVKQSVILNDAFPSSAITALLLSHDTTGTPANGLGPRLEFAAESSTTVDRTQGYVLTQWSDVTDATRSAYFDFQLINGGAGPTTRMRLFPSGGLSVNNTTDPGAGIVSANTGYWVGTAASTSGKILKSDGAAFKPSTETYAAPGTSGNVMTSDGTNWTSAAPAGGSGVVKNSSTADQTGFAADTYLAGSNCVVGAGAFAAKNQYHCTFDMSKTALGTAAMTIDVRIGTAGTTSDTSRMTFTFGAGTAAADNGTFEVWITFRTVGSGTSAVVSGICRGTKGANSSGLFTNANNIPVTNIQGTTSGGFDSSAATTIGISVNGGASFAGTNKLVQAELF